MENLVFSLNATMPIFLMMILGFIFHKIGFFDESFANKMNKFVFVVALPVLLFKDLSTADFYSVWDTKFVLYCFIVTFVSIVIAIVVSLLLKDKSIQGEFVQAAYRSSPALLGAAFVQNIYGEVGAASLMIIGAVPLYNIMAVVVLAVMKPERGKLNKTLLFKTAKGIITNPLIIGVIVGIIWSILKIPQPIIFQKTVSGFAAVATPLGLMALGACFDLKKAFAKLKPALLCCAFKLLIFVIIFLPFAIYLGFRQDKLVSVLVMLGAATTVSSFVMARNMGHEGTLSASAVMLTTFLSAFTLTFWLYITKSFELI